MMPEDISEQEIRYQLFILHAQGICIESHTCPNCGEMPHLKEKREGRIVYGCLQCKCVSSTMPSNDKGNL